MICRIMLLCFVVSSCATPEQEIIRPLRGVTKILKEPMEMSAIRCYRHLVENGYDEMAAIDSTHKHVARIQLSMAANRKSKVMGTTN